MICTAQQYYLGDQEEWDWRGMWQEWQTGKVLTGFWWGDLREITTWKTQA
jgi:hypothetical protein